MRIAQPSDRKWAEEASTQLCMTVEHAQKFKPLGTFFVALNLRVA